MIAPTNEPIAIAQQRAFVHAFRNSTQLWADTQQQEGLRYKDSSQEYARQLEQSNQAVQNLCSSAVQNCEQVLTSLNPVNLAQALQEQLETPFTPTIEDSTKQPVVEFSTSVDTLAKLTSGIQLKAKVRQEIEAESISTRRRYISYIAIIAIFLIVLLVLRLV